VTVVVPVPRVMLLHVVVRAVMARPVVVRMDAAMVRMAPVTVHATVAEPVVAVVVMPVSSVSAVVEVSMVASFVPGHRRMPAATPPRRGVMAGRRRVTHGAARSGRGRGRRQVHHGGEHVRPARRP
jgi:hypothetical protein